MGALVSTGRDCVGLALLASSRGVSLRFNYRGEEKDSTKGLHRSSWHFCLDPLSINTDGLLRNGKKQSLKSSHNQQAGFS